MLAWVRQVSMLVSMLGLDRLDRFPFRQVSMLAC